MALSALEALEVIKRQMDVSRVDAVPEGFLTVQQWADAWGMTYGPASHWVKGAISRGVMEEKSFRVRNGKVLRDVAHYRMVELKPKKGKR